MFKKLLKHDMKAVWRVGWISAVIVPVATILAILSTRLLNANNSNDTMPIIVAKLFAGILLFASVLGIILSYIFTMILVLLRYYKNFFTDEGYLTFTLPTTRSMLLLSKTLNAFIWLTAHAILIIAALATYILFFPSDEAKYSIVNFEAYKNIARLFSMAFDSIGIWSIVIIALAFMTILIMIIMSITILQISITIGSVIVKKAKIIASIGIYYAINTALSMFWQFIYIAFLSTMFSSSSAVSISKGGEVGAVIALIILLYIAITAVIASLLYCLNQTLLNRKLNLA